MFTEVAIFWFLTRSMTILFMMLMATVFLNYLLQNDLLSS